jgi:hypothetical protein
METLIQFVTQTVKRGVVLVESVAARFVAATVVAVAYAEQIAEQAPVVGETAVTAAAAVAGAVAVVRNVIPAPKEVKGILFDPEELLDKLGVDLSDVPELPFDELGEADADA